ncbi:MAG: membrane dipeptidase [Bacteroidota bacterium]|jgi:membrane dipeptidase
MQSRKEFLRAAMTIAAVSPFLNLKSFADFKNSASEHVYFDLHSHPGWNFAKKNFGDNTDASITKLVANMGEGHLTGAFYAIVADAGLLKPTATGITVTGKYASGEGWATYKKQVTQLKNLFNTVDIQFSTNAKDLKTSNAKTIGYISVEGGDFLEGNFDKLEEAYQDGVRSIQLVHYAPNEVGDLQTADASFNGLSPFGKELIKKMNHLGLVIDLAHASYQTTKDVAAITKAPIILSHSMLEMEPDRPIAKRAISKEHAKLIADTGGVVGAWPSGFNKNFDEYVDNIKRLIDVIGIDHVGIGTDMDANFKPVLSKYSEFPKLAEALQSKGFSASETGKIMGGNAKRVLSKVLKNK